MSDINIRDVQHFMYCPHRWGLMEIDDAWAENYFVVKANLLHERVHRPDSYTMRGKTVYAAVTVWNDLPQYELFGVTDCIEADKNGLCIVEYKPTRPKAGDYREEDAVQLYAQKLCVDFVLGSDCRGEIYYADVRKRVRVPFEKLAPGFDTKLRAALEQMRAYRASGRIPPIMKNQFCGGCSMKDICMPKVKTRYNFRAQLSKMMEVRC